MQRQRAGLETDDNRRRVPLVERARHRERRELPQRLHERGGTQLHPRLAGDQHPLPGPPCRLRMLAQPAERSRRRHGRQLAPTRQRARGERDRQPGSERTRSKGRHGPTKATGTAALAGATVDRPRRERGQCARAPRAQPPPAPAAGESADDLALGDEQLCVRSEGHPASPRARAHRRGGPAHQARTPTRLARVEAGDRAEGHDEPDATVVAHGQHVAPALPPSGPSVSTQRPERHAQRRLLRAERVGESEPHPTARGARAPRAEGARDEGAVKVAACPGKLHQARGGGLGARSEERPRLCDARRAQAQQSERVHAAGVALARGFATEPCEEAQAAGLPFKRGREARELADEAREGGGRLQLIEHAEALAQALAVACEPHGLLGSPGASSPHPQGVKGSAQGEAHVVAQRRARQANAALADEGVARPRGEGAPEGRAHPPADRRSRRALHGRLAAPGPVRGAELAGAPPLEGRVQAHAGLVRLGGCRAPRAPRA